MISIHASRGGSDVADGLIQKQMNISIHASRGGSDLVIGGGIGIRISFQSTLPVGEATRFPTRRRRKSDDFNPRFPWGKRHIFLACREKPDIFQSTLPVGEATAAQLVKALSHNNFNPRFPWGKRRTRRNREEKVD